MQIEESARALLIVTAFAWSIPCARHAASVEAKDVKLGLAIRK